MSGRGGTVKLTHSLKMHYRAGSGSAFLFVHLWNHTNLVSSITRVIGQTGLIGRPSGPSSTRRRQIRSTAPARLIKQPSQCPSKQGRGYIARGSSVICLLLPISSIPTSFWQYPRSASAFLSRRAALPKVSRPTGDAGSPSDLESFTTSCRGSKQPHKLFATVAMEMIATLKQGLSKQARYWAGIRGVENIFDARLISIPGLDALGVSEKIAKIVASPNGGNLTTWTDYPLIKSTGIPEPAMTTDPALLTWENVVATEDAQPGGQHSLAGFSIADGGELILVRVSYSLTQTCGCSSGISIFVHQLPLVELA